jgi:catalase
MPDTPEETFEGIDLLDPTKLVPEELCPVVPVGMLTLNRNPSNYFAETEQVAFHTGHLVPGIEPSADPLLQVRMFSYLDTQISRLGGPNFGQLPINRPRAEVNDNLRDGMHQTQVHTGVAPYTPNSLGGGCPYPADLASAYVETPRPVEGTKIRANPASFDDHFTQAAMFYRSLTDVERLHIVEAISFELAKCHDVAIRERELGVLAQVDRELVTSVAAELGLPAPDVEPVGDVLLSPALSQLSPDPSPAAGRVVGVVVLPGDELPDLGPLLSRSEAGGVTVRLIAPTGAPVVLDGRAVAPERTYATVRSVELDAVVLAGNGAPVAVDPRVTTLLDEAYRHFKPLMIVGDPATAEAVLPGLTAGPGVVVGGGAPQVDELFELLGRHRVWARPADSPVQV